jgi:hypothetical protein
MATHVAMVLYTARCLGASGQRTLPAPNAFIAGVDKQPKVNIWKAATWLVIEHGYEAPALVDQMLSVLERMHADECLIASWREIGEAVRELLEAGSVKP